MQAPRIEWARAMAREQLRRFGVEAIEHIRVEGFARARGAVIQLVKLDGADTQFVRNDNHSTILLSDRVTEYPTQRFSIAHELGHLLLGHPSHTACSHQGKTSKSPAELEANAFASELLMPQHLLGTACDGSPVDLVIPQRISATYNVSILASSIRFTELAREPCAAVFSKAGKVRWARTSAGFRHEIAEGQLLEPTSIAHACLERRGFPTTPTDVPATAWFRTQAAVRIVEHAIYSAEHATALSMLWLPANAALALAK